MGEKEEGGGRERFKVSTMEAIVGKSRGFIGLEALLGELGEARALLLLPRSLLLPPPAPPPPPPPPPEAEEAAVPLARRERYIFEALEA